MGLSRAERETIIRYDLESPEMTVYTHEGRLKDHLLRSGGSLKSTSKHDGLEVAWTVIVPRDWFRRPRKKRQLSESELHRRRQQMSQNRVGSIKESGQGLDPGDGGAE